MPEVTFTFRVEETLKAEFFNAAKACDRTGVQLLRAFMRDFVQQQHQAAEHDVWFRLQVQKGIGEADAGEVMSHQDVETKFAARRESVRGKLGIPD